MRIFVPVVVLAAMAAIFFGNTKTRLCASMIVLAVALGDPLVVNTIKHAVARPRPFVTLPDARVFGVVGKGYVPPDKMTAYTPGLNSMPSAHAANWFAATMIILLFNRKKRWLVISVAIMACAVSFSRVYNGVHYPSDVLAGAILGAGYAAAIAIGLQSLWDFGGRKWFPAWHARLPNLLNPEARIPSAEIQTQNSKLEIQNSHWLRFGYILIFAALIGRLAYLASGTIELSQDEAYQWTWSKHLAPSYYSKPPGIAYIQFAGTHLFGDTQFGVRFFSPLFAAILSFIVFRFFAREVNGRAAFWLLLAVTAVPLLGVGSILMTIDPPMVLCWTWAMLAGWRALQSDEKTRDWLVVGLAMGLGFLCKYNVIYEIVCFGIFFALRPSARTHLRKPGPWLALLIFGICTLPVIIWNAQNGWITVHHVAGNAGLNGQWHPTLRYFWDFIFQEFALLNPFFFIGSIWAAIAFWKVRSERPLWLYFFCLSAPVLLGHLLWSFHSRIQPNWIAPAILPAFCLMIAYWNEKFGNGGRFIKPVFTFGIALGFFAIAIMYQSNLISRLAGGPLPGEKDPARRVRAWKQEAVIVENAREKLQANGKPSFIICSHYGITGLYSFYIPQAHRDVENSQPMVYPADFNVPKNQFYFWPEYNYLATRKGQNAIYVSEIDLYVLEKDWVWKWLANEPVNHTVPPPKTLPPAIAGQFESTADLGEQDVTIGHRVFHRIHLWACYHLK